MGQSHHAPINKTYAEQEAEIERLTRQSNTLHSENTKLKEENKKHVKEISEMTHSLVDLEKRLEEGGEIQHMMEANLNKAHVAIERLTRENEAYKEIVYLQLNKERG